MHLKAVAGFTTRKNCSDVFPPAETKTLGKMRSIWGGVMSEERGLTEY